MRAHQTQGGVTNRRDFIFRAALGGAAILGARQLTATAAAAQAGGAVTLAPPDKQPPNLPVPRAPEKKVGWAIVGLGELALGEIMPAFGVAKWAAPTALVSGHEEKARSVAAAYGMKDAKIYNYEDFDRIAEDPRVDVIYIVLPNSMHAEFTIRGLKAGKHVLCEKPMAVSIEECERMIAAAREAKRTLGVAYRLHSEPMNRRVMEMCTKKEFGEIKTFESSNCQDTKAPNIRLSAALGGGPVGDVGIYSINAARYTIGEEPVEVSAMAHQPKDDPRFREVPESVSFLLRYPSGAIANCTCSFGTSESRRYRVQCAKGWIEMDPAFSYRGLRLRSKRSAGEASGEVEATEHVIQAVDHFAAEMDHFSDCILHGTKLRTPGELGLADIRITTAIAEAVRTGKTVRL